MARPSPILDPRQADGGARVSGLPPLVHETTPNVELVLRAPARRPMLLPEAALRLRLRLLLQLQI